MADDLPRTLRLGRTDARGLRSGQVLSLLSHELRGPLGVIRGSLRLLDQYRDLEADLARQTVRAILKASDRVAEILDQASLLAHLELGDVKIERKRVPLARLLQEAVDAVALSADTPASLALAPVPPLQIHADPARLSSSLAALMYAIARAQTRAVIVELSAARSRRGALPGVRLRIEPQTLPRVTTRESDLDTRRGGLGLTLPIAATVIRAHRGTVKELRHGERSVGVTVWLPLAAARPGKRILRRRRTITP